MKIDLRINKFATLSDQAVFETLTDLDVGDVKIPKGFKTDGASLPRWVVLTSMALILVGGLSSGWFANTALVFGWLVMFMAYLIPPFGKYTLAAAAHDKLLETQSRKIADRKMKQLLRVLGISGFWVSAMYRFVRLNSIIRHREMG